MMDALKRQLMTSASPSIPAFWGLSFTAFRPELIATFRDIRNADDRRGRHRRSSNRRLCALVNRGRDRIFQPLVTNRPAAASRLGRVNECSLMSGRPPVPRAIITLVLLLASLAAARADIRIVSSAGGEVGSYLRLFAAVRQSGQRVIIDGPCLSACTLC